MRNVSAETHMDPYGLCERKMWFAHAQESKHDLKCEMFAIIGVGERNWIPSDLFQKWGSLPRRCSRHAFRPYRCGAGTRDEPLGGKKWGWFRRNNCAIACDTRAQFWWGRRAKNKQTGVENYLHGKWINSIFCHHFRENFKQRRFERCTSSGSRLFALLSLYFEQILGQMVSLIK